MSLKSKGSLFSGFDEIFLGTYKKYADIDNMPNVLQDSFKGQFKINNEGISEFTAEQIKAKAAAMGFTDSLTNQAVAFASDASFTEKAATGKLTFGKAIKDNAVDVESLGEALKKTGKLDENRLARLDDASKVSKEYYKHSIGQVLEEVPDLANATIEATSDAVASTSALGNTFKGLYATIAPLLPLIAAAGAAFAVFKVAQGYVMALDNAIKSSQESQSEYANTTSEVKSLNTELETTKNRINELNAKESLTITEEAELQKLRSQNDELQRQIDLKNTIAKDQSKDAAESAVDALELERTMDLTTGTETTGRMDQKVTKYEQTDILTATRNELDKLEEYKEKRKKLLAEYNKDGTSDKQKSSLENQIDKVDAKIKGLSNNLESQINNLNSIKDGFVDEMTGGIKDGYEGWNDQITSLIDKYNGIDLSPAEKKSKQLDSYFNKKSGNNFVKELLQEVASEGENLQTVLHRLGLSLSDVGKDISLDDLTKYFDDLSKAASEAADEVNKVNNNLTMDDVGAAFESKNAGDDYVSMNDYLKKAKDLFDKGLIGTDDFKSVSEAISYGIDSSAGAFAANYKKLQKYFTEDSKGNLYPQGLNNFLTDLRGLDKGYAEYTETLDENGNSVGKWNLNMKNTAQAAKDMGISVQSMEAILGRLQDYDGAGDINFRSALGDLDTAKQSIEGLQGLYESTSDKATKEKLKASLDRWNGQYSQWENDLATLDENAVIHLKLEYDLATIQQKIDELKATQKGEGGQNSETNANILAGQQQYISKSENTLGLNNEGVTIPVKYKTSEDSINSLYNELSQLTAGSDEYFEVQAKIQNLQNIQQQILDAFADQHPEITAESNIEQINDAWNSFMDSAQANEIIASITADTSDAESKINALKQQEVEDKVVSLVGEDKATPVMYLWNSLNADPKFASLSAQDQATYMIEYWNGLPFEDKTAILSSILQAEDDATPTIGAVDGAVGGMKLDPTVNIGASDGATGTINSVSASLFALNGKTATTYIHTVHTSSGKGKLSGTAHSNGTAGLYPIPKLSGRALAMGTLQDDSWLKPSWRTKKSEVALTGEEGQELVATRANRWFTVGDNGAEFASIPQGSIVFNAKQTEELFKNGKINSRGKSYASGTAYAGGASGGFQFGGGASSYNPPNSYYPPAASESWSNTVQDSVETISSGAESTGDALKELTDNIDHVTDKLDRLQRATERAQNEIERANGITNKENANSKALEAIKSEIEGNKQAYQTYADKAQQFASESGLSTDLQEKIQSGAYEINNYDDDTKSKISEYKSLYENALDAQDKVLELQDEELKLAQERLSYIEDYYDATIKVNDALNDMRDAQLELRDALGDSAVSNDVKKTLEESLKEQEESYNQSVAQLSKYQNEFNNLVKNGYIKEGSDAWFEGQEKMADFAKQIAESNIALIELQDKIREVDYTKIQQVIDGIGRGIDRLQNGIDLKESRDQFVGRKDYQKQIDSQHGSIQSNYTKRNQKLNEQKYYAVGSTRYQELAEEISKIDGEINNSLVEIEKLRDKVFEAEFFNFDKDIKNMNGFRDELDTFRSLLNKDAFFDKDTGAMTGEAYANISLISKGMSTAKKEIATYTAGIKKLDQMLKSGLISQTEYDEKQKEMLDGIRDSVGAVNDYRNELLDLHETQMRKENEALKENIGLRKDALSKQKEYWDYANKVKSQTKDVDALNAQIAALQGVKLFARVLFNCGKIPITLIRYNVTGNGRRECGTCL